MSFDVNRITLVGTVIDPPRVFVVKDKTKLVLRVMTQKKKGDDGGVFETYHSVVLWDTWAKRMNGRIHQGQRVFVEGEQRYRNVERKDERGAMTKKELFAEVSATNVEVITPSSATVSRPHHQPQRRIPYEDPQSRHAQPSTEATREEVSAWASEEPAAPPGEAYPETWDDFEQ